MNIQPYLFFEGRCREAIEFYQKSIGAEVIMVSKFGDSPDPQACAGAPADSIMHGALKIGDSTLLVSDGRSSGKQSFTGFALSISPDTDEQAKAMFEAISAGGQITMPLQKTFFASTFGMCTDKFGVHWMVHVEDKK